MTTATDKARDFALRHRRGDALPGHLRTWTANQIRSKLEEAISKGDFETVCKAFGVSPKEYIRAPHKLAKLTKRAGLSGEFPKELTNTPEAREVAKDSTDAPPKRQSLLAELFSLKSERGQTFEAVEVDE